MPEKIGKTNQVQLNANEIVIGIDGQQVKVPQIVRVYEFPDHDLIQIQGINSNDQDAKIEVPVKGGTIESFCEMDFTK